MGASSLKLKAILVCHGIDNLVCLLCSIWDFFNKDPKTEFSLLGVLVAVSALVGIPCVVQCFWAVNARQWRGVGSYLWHALVTPIFNMVYVRDLALRFAPCDLQGQQGAGTWCDHFNELTISIPAVFAGIRLWSGLALQNYLDDGGDRFSMQDQKSQGAEDSASRKQLTRLPKGVEAFSGVVKFFDEKKGYGFITLDGQSQDIYFKQNCLSPELQALRSDVRGVAVKFIIRWMPDGTPQVRAAVSAASYQGQDGADTVATGGNNNTTVEKREPGKQGEPKIEESATRGDEAYAEAIKTLCNIAFDTDKDKGKPSSPPT